MSRPAVTLMLAGMVLAVACDHPDRPPARVPRSVEPRGAVDPRPPGTTPVGTAPTPAAADPPRPKDRLTVAEAREYMLTLVNRDRRTEGLPPVELDLEAPTRAGQAHADDMASLGYLGHWGSDGSVPEERLTREGGADMVLENASCFTDERPRVLDTRPLIESRRVEEAERMFFDEVPPNDGHRRNILRRGHNRLGIGIAQPVATVQELPVPCFSQEFVDRHGVYEPLPGGAANRGARLGDTVRVAGRIMPPYEVTAVGLARIELPRSLPAQVLNQRRSYPVPRPYELFWRKGFVTRVPLEIGADGAFSVTTVLDDKGQPGLYEISVWGKLVGGEHVMLGLRTLRVE